MKNWKLPLTILILLILAMAFRWGTLGTKTDDLTTYKFVIDRWNGAIYKDSFKSSGYKREIQKTPSISSTELTGYWDVAMAIDIAWLLYALSKTKKKEVKDNSINT